MHITIGGRRDRFLLRRAAPVAHLDLQLTRDFATIFSFSFFSDFSLLLMYG